MSKNGQRETTKGPHGAPSGGHRVLVSLSVKGLLRLGFHHFSKKKYSAALTASSARIQALGCRCGTGLGRRLNSSSPQVLDAPIQELLSFPDQGDTALLDPVSEPARIWLCVGPSCGPNRGITTSWVTLVLRVDNGTGKRPKRIWRRPAFTTIIQMQSEAGHSLPLGGLIK